MDQEKITQFFNEGNYWEALDYLKENSKQKIIFYLIGI